MRFTTTIRRMADGGFVPVGAQGVALQNRVDWFMLVIRWDNGVYTYHRADGLACWHGLIAL